MKFILESNLKLISLNQAFATLRNGRRIRSKNYVDFAKRLRAELFPRILELQTFESQFIPKQHALKATLKIGTPNLFTATGAISKKSGDIANYEKCLIDNVLTCAVDDSAITIWKMCKYPSEKHEFSLILEIIPI